MRINARFRALCAATMLYLIVPAGAAPTAVPSARREIQQAYNKIDAALGRKDVDTAFDYDAEDCQYYDKKGHLLEDGSGRQQTIDLLNQVDALKETDVITSFTGSEAGATVTVKEHAQVFLANTVTGRAARIAADAVFRDYWVKTDDGWRRKRSREIKGGFAIHKNF